MTSDESDSIFPDNDDVVERWRPSFERAGFGDYDIDFSCVGPEMIAHLGRAIDIFFEAQETKMKMEREREVTPGSVWRHHNGNVYTVLLLTNEGAMGENAEKYPVMVVYQGENGKTWSRKLSDWHRSMTQIK